MGDGFVLASKFITKKDTPIVGGKTSSLGEMINKVNVPIPDFYAITSSAYTHFLKSTGLDLFIKKQIESLDIKNLRSLQRVGKNIRNKIRTTKMPEDLEKSILKEYHVFSKKYKKNNVLVAVRSSATAEDLADASFAGQQDTYLNVVGDADVLDKVRLCFASLFTDRAISYREDKKFDHLQVKLSITVQKMVNSLASGVAFTIDPDSGFKNVVVLTAAWGLGEYVVQGKVTPDEYLFFKPTKKIISKKLGDKKLKLVRSGMKGNKELKTTKAERGRFVLTTKQAELLAEYCVRIEKHYGRAMDIEWALDYDNNRLYIVQARPETVQSNKDVNVIEHFKLRGRSSVLVKGKSVGRKIGTGKVRVILDVKDIHSFKKGEVLVTTMTDPDWEPIMKIASAIVTDLGGSTSHAAIVSREIGVPAIVGCVNASTTLKTGQLVTVDSTDNVGKVWKGALKYVVQKIKVDKVPKTKTKVMLNLGDPDQAFDLAQLPIDGVALAREEFIIANHIREHPLFMMKEGRGEEFVDKLAEGIGRIAAAFYPREVILRTSDFKSNEYRTLKGGEEFEPNEENPMIGWRGVSRYINPKYAPAFKLELDAINRVRNDFGLKNLSLLIPFCRTLNEADLMYKILKTKGLVRGKDGLRVYVMAEVPSNIILFDEFAKRFDGFSIGSNDLTQLTLGIDRDSVMLTKEFDERDPAVLSLIKTLIDKSNKAGKYVGICGDAPSTHPEYAEILVKYGIHSMGLTPDVILETKLKVAKFESKLK